MKIPGRISPMTRAAIVLKLQDEGLKVDQIASRLGVTTQTVRNLLALHLLAPELKVAVADGALPMRHALKLAGKPHDKQREVLKQLLDADATRGARADNSIRDGLAGKPERIGLDTRKMRSRELLERWANAVADSDLQLCAVLRFVLGDPLKDRYLFLPHTLAALAKAGYKG